MCAYRCTDTLVVNKDSSLQPLAVMQRRYSYYTSYFVIIEGNVHGAGLSNFDAAKSFLSDTYFKFHSHGNMMELGFRDWSKFQLTGVMLFDLDFVPAQLPYVPGV